MIVGLDSNILCYVLEPTYPEHNSLSDLLDNLSPENMVALNPTVFHESFHVLVFYLQWFPQEAAKRFSALLKNPYVAFFNQTKKTAQIALNLAVKHDLGGRDALIIASYLVNKVPVMYTHDQELLKLQKISWKNTQITLKDPLKKKPAE